jgi:hypothetical protein
VSISRLNFDGVSESDLAELVIGQVPEGLHLDYKRDTYGTSDADKRELLKDVSAFANANGGHIIVGMDETEGVASNLCGIKTADIDVEVSRLDQIIRTGIEPRIPGCRLRAIPLSSQSHAIVIRIPRSWRLPHRVCSQNSNRFFIRNSAGSHEASMDELRHLFTLSVSAIDRARAFRAERMALITSGSGSRPLAGNGRFILHIIPLSAVSSTATVDLAHVYSNRGAFWPLGCDSGSTRYNFDGLIIESGGEINDGYTQVFRSGIVEATIACLVNNRTEKPGIAGLSFERYVFNSFGKYIDGLKSLNVEPPLIIMCTLEGVEGADYHVVNSIFNHGITPIDRSILHLPDCIIEDFSADNADYHRAVKPAFDALWNTIGYSESRFFDKDTGLWKGR